MNDVIPQKTKTPSTFSDENTGINYFDSLKGQKINLSHFSDLKIFEKKFREILIAFKQNRNAATEQALKNWLSEPELKKTGNLALKKSVLQECISQNLSPQDGEVYWIFKRLHLSTLSVEERNVQIKHMLHDESVLNLEDFLDFALEYRKEYTPESDYDLLFEATLKKIATSGIKKINIGVMLFYYYLSKQNQEIKSSSKNEWQQKLRICYTQLERVKENKNISPSEKIEIFNALALYHRVNSNKEQAAIYNNSQLKLLMSTPRSSIHAYAQRHREALLMAQELSLESKNLSHDEKIFIERMRQLEFYFDPTQNRSLEELPSRMQQNRYARLKISYWIEKNSTNPSQKLLELEQALEALEKSTLDTEEIKKMRLQALYQKAVISGLLSDFANCRKILETDLSAYQNKDLTTEQISTLNHHLRLNFDLGYKMSELGFKKESAQILNEYEELESKSVWKNNKKIAGLSVQTYQKYLNSLSQDHLRLHLVYHYQRIGQRSKAENILNSFLANSEKTHPQYAQMQLLLAWNHLWNGNAVQSQKIIQSLNSSKSQLQAYEIELAKIQMLQSLFPYEKKENRIQALQAVKTQIENEPTQDKKSKQMRLAGIDLEIQKIQAQNLSLAFETGTQDRFIWVDTQFLYPASTSSGLKLFPGKTVQDNQKLKKKFIEFRTSYDLSPNITLLFNHRQDAYENPTSQSVVISQSETQDPNGNNQLKNNGNIPIPLFNSRSQAPSFESKAAINFKQSFQKNSSLDPFKVLTHALGIQASFGQDEFFLRPSQGLSLNSQALLEEGKTNISLPALQTPAALKYHSLQINNELVVAFLSQKFSLKNQGIYRSAEFFSATPTPDGIRIGQLKNMNSLTLRSQMGWQSPKLFSVLSLSPYLAFYKTQILSPGQPEPKAFYLPGIQLRYEFEYLRSLFGWDDFAMAILYEKANQSTFKGLSPIEKKSIQLSGAKNSFSGSVGYEESNFSFGVNQKLGPVPLTYSRGMGTDQRLYLQFQKIFDLQTDQKNK